MLGMILGYTYPLILHAAMHGDAGIFLKEDIGKACGYECHRQWQPGKGSVR